MALLQWEQVYYLPIAFRHQPVSTNTAPSFQISGALFSICAMSCLIHHEVMSEDSDSDFPSCKTDFVYSENDLNLKNLPPPAFLTLSSHHHVHSTQFLCFSPYDTSTYHFLLRSVKVISSKSIQEVVIGEKEPLLWYTRKIFIDLHGYYHSCTLDLHLSLDSWLTLENHSRSQNLILLFISIGNLH